MIQCTVTPAAGKRLIAKAIAEHAAVRQATRSGTLVIIAGTTNGYVAEEVLASCGQAGDFCRGRFMRGAVLPPVPRDGEARSGLSAGEFPGDVIIRQGEWLKGKTIFDVVDDLQEGDVVLKGANSVDLSRMQAAVLIGDRKGGTVMAALQAVIGRRVRMIVPVGLEKRVTADVNVLAAKLNTPGASGPRLLPVVGEVITELQAFESLTGACCDLVAGGGVCGAEGAVWLALSGSEEQETSVRAILDSVGPEPPFGR